MESCVGKSYAEVWEIYKAKHGDTADTRKVHLKWKKLAAEVK